MNLGPYELGRVHHGDCRALLRKVPLASIDAFVTDPPYSSGGAFRGDRALQSVTDKYVQTGQKTIAPEFEGDTRDQRSFTLWCDSWLTACWHRAKPGGVVLVFSDWRQYPAVSDALQMAGWVWRGAAVWDKTEGIRPQLGRFRQQGEFILWGSRGAHPMIGETVPGVFRCNPSQTGGDHITAKPEPVIEWLLRMTRPGAIVCDPFTGGGAVGVACRRLGREFLGFELSAVWTEYANRRLGLTPDHQDTPLFSGVT